MSNIEKPSKKTSYHEALSALTEVLSAREKDLDAREEQIEKDRQELDKDRHAAYGDTNPSDVLHLNVGGTETTVLRRTLTSVPGSMLASRFSGRWDESLEKDENGHFFIDQEYSLFRHVLKHLRNKANGDGTCIVNSPNLPIDIDPDVTYQDFYRMVEYYGLTDAIYPVALKFHDGDFLDGLDTEKVDASEWTTFSLAPKGHDRRVKTYEVTIGNVQRLQIGWTISSWNIDLGQSNDNGVGDVMHTFALDITRSSYLLDGKATPVDRLEQKKGTVVRSEDFGKAWYVNGNLVAPFSKEKWDGMKSYETGFGGYNSRQVQPFPFISVKGDIEVTSLELRK